MKQTLNISHENPIVHIKAYGGLQIMGGESTEVICDVESPDLVTLLEEEGQVYVTANASCQLTLPVSSFIEIEKGMGSIEIEHNENQIKIGKVLGNLILQHVKTAKVGKIGGNFSVRHASDIISVGKVGGEIVVENVGSFSCEKSGGRCFCKDIQGDFSLGKAGGGTKAENITGKLVLNKLGGSLVAKNVNIAKDISVGGDVRIKSSCTFVEDIALRAGGDIHVSLDDWLDGQNLSFRAGGDVDVALDEGFEGAVFSLSSSSEDIRINFKNLDLEIDQGHYDYQVGESDRKIDIAAGGDIAISGLSDVEFNGEKVIEDLSEYFDYQESPYSELIQDRVRFATRKADAKIKAAQVRLEQIQEQVEKFRGFDVGFEGTENIPEPAPVPPIPPVSRGVRKKGATDEERLMILKMLQEKTISVDEAETLFKALED